MAHIRTQVRQAITAALTGLPTTGTNCFTMRTYPTGAKQLPALLVYMPGERSETSAMGGGQRSLERFMTAAIEAQAAGIGFDDELDQIALEVEKALFQSNRLGGLAVSLTLQSTRLELSDGKAGSERRSGVLTLEYLVEVDGPEGDPETID